MPNNIKTGLINKSRPPFIRSLTTKEKLEVRKYSKFLQDFGDNFEQKRAVVSNSKRILVLAGAGSGKTKVLTKRFIHLVENKMVRQNNILALTFSNSAAQEMRQRIAKSLDTKPENINENVKTFHSFCRKILSQNEQFDLITERKEQIEIARIIVEKFGKNKEIMNCMNNYIKNNILTFIRKRDIRNKIEPQIKNKPRDFGDRRIKTIKGVKVRSKSERDIANFLTLLGIEWEYEKPAEWMSYKDQNGNIHYKWPDFYLPEFDIYIEYWCYNDKTPSFPQIDKKRYLENREWKVQQYESNKKVLISVEEEEMLDLIEFQKRLKTEIEKHSNRRFEGKELTYLDLYRDYYQTAVFPQYKESYDHFLEEIVEIINLVKSTLLTVNDVKERVGDENKEKVVNFYKVLIPVMEEYEKFLDSVDWGLKDFNDLINDALELLRKYPKRRSFYQNKYTHILVDEFQDVSLGQVELLKLLMRDETSLFVVGDDWQSIYGWRGSDVRFILEFDKHFGNYEKVILPINYRSTKNIVDASTHFIQMKGNHHIKNIRCCKEKEKDTSKIKQLNARTDLGGTQFIIRKIMQLKEQDSSLIDSNFLILFRSRRSSILFRKFLKEYFKEYNLKVNYKTIHYSKGLQFKYVFIVGLKGGTYGFPNVHADNDIRQVIMTIPIEEKEEEERRLFYVAMTRAEKELFLISEKGNESEFVREIPKEYIEVL